MLRIFKFIVLLAILTTAVLAILYVLELFTDEMLTSLVEKTLKITGIVTAASLVVIFLTGSRNGQ